MPTRLEVLHATNAVFGLVTDIETVPTELECPAHELPLTMQRLNTVNGWQGITVCPGFDGTCRYDPNGHPAPVPAPDAEDAAAGPRTGPAANRTTGGF